MNCVVTDLQFSSYFGKSTASLRPTKHQHDAFCSLRVLHELIKETSIKPPAAKHRGTAKVFWPQTGSSEGSERE